MGYLIGMEDDIKNLMRIDLHLKLHFKKSPQRLMFERSLFSPHQNNNKRYFFKRYIIFFAMILFISITQKRLIEKFYRPS